jgi:hypothetical protein
MVYVAGDGIDMDGVIPANMTVDYLPTPLPVYWRNYEANAHLPWNWSGMDLNDATLLETIPVQYRLGCIALCSRNVDSWCTNGDVIRDLVYYDLRYWKGPVA